MPDPPTPTRDRPVWPRRPAAPPSRARRAPAPTTASKSWKPMFLIAKVSVSINLSLAPKGSGGLGHPHRDQERELAAVGRACRPLRDEPSRRDPRRRGLDPPGDPALARGHRRHDLAGARSPMPRTTATSPSPTWCRWRRSREWVEELRATLPEPPHERRARLQAGLGLLRPRHARHGRRRGARAGRGDDRGRRDTAGRPQVVAR